MHFCGIYGLKPTDRRVSLAGHILEIPGQPTCIRQMLVPGPIARSVKDLQLCFSLIAGPDPRQPDVPPVPTNPMESRPLSELRIAWADDFRVPVAVDIQNTLHAVVDKLTMAGVMIKKWTPESFDWAAAQSLYNRIAIYTFRYAQPLTLAAIGKSMQILWRESTQGNSALRQLVSPFQALKEFSSLSLQGYYEALTERDRFTSQLEQALEQWDAWLVPVAATSAFTHRPNWSAIDIDGVSYPHSAANGAYTMPFNLTGHPAVVIPVGQTQTGLPIGLQIVGKRWGEMELLMIAEELDKIVGSFRNPLEYNAMCN